MIYSRTYLLNLFTKDLSRIENELKTETSSVKIEKLEQIR